MKVKVLNIIIQAKLLAPKIFPKNQEIDELSGQPEWYGFEHKSWSLGEDIRQLLKQEKKLKKDPEVQHAILEIINLKDLRRGRQSFAMLLGNVGSKDLHKEVAKHLEDSDINGHILDTLYKMKVYDYYEEVRQLTKSEFPWVRKLANQYIEKSSKV